MYKKIKRFSFYLLFCLIFIVLFSSFYAVYGATVNTKVADTGNKLANGTTFESLYDSIKVGTYNAFMLSAQEDFINPSVLIEYTIGQSQSISMGEVDTSPLREMSTSEIKLVFEILKSDGTSVQYNIGTYTSLYDCGGGSSCKNPIEIKDPNTGEVIDIECGGCPKLGSNDDTLEYQGRVSLETSVFLSGCQEASLEGVAAGNIAAGFNIGTAYSDSQKALADVMEEIDNGFYDFKRVRSVNYSLSSFCSPLFGHMYLTQEPKVIYEESEWLSKVRDNKGTVISGSSVIINQAYKTFISEIDRTGELINERGERITKNINFKNGVDRYEGVSGSKKPQSVLSYMMPLATPYLFEVSSSWRGSLLDKYLHTISGYQYCIYNERLYDGNYQEVTTMPNVGVDRTQLYLYKVEADGFPVGVVIVAYFDECIVDTTQDGDKPTLYLTGRKIGFTNGYSDKLDFKNANVNLMFNTGESGKEGYLPLCVSFPVPTEELQGYTLADVVSGRVATSSVGNDVLQIVEELTSPPTSDEISAYIKERGNHAKFPKYVELVKVFIDFGYIGINDENETNSMNNSGTQEDEKENGKWAFYIVHNNAYLTSNESLVSWLRSDMARSLTYVDASALVAKITGDFTDNLGKLSYADWKRMQEIKSELDYDKDMWLVRVFNVVSMVMGVFLIIFAILFVVAYWVDYYNTLTRFSILQFVSFGNLYPIWDKDTIPYTPMANSNVKYVTFKDTLIIAFLMCAAGFFFLNVSSIVQLFVYLYNYILFVFGGAK